jgi:hypothetical protein
MHQQPTFKSHKSSSRLIGITGRRSQESRKLDDGFPIHAFCAASG